MKNAHNPCFVGVYYFTITCLQLIIQISVKKLKLFYVFNGFSWIRIRIIWYGSGFRIQPFFDTDPDPGNWYGFHGSGSATLPPRIRIIRAARIIIIIIIFLKWYLFFFNLCINCRIVTKFYNSFCYFATTVPLGQSATAQTRSLFHRLRLKLRRSSSGSTTI